MLIAQVTTATFYGIVNDPSGSIIPAAQVTLTNEGTGAKTTKVSDDRGEFVFDFLPVGRYTLSIEGKGFKRHEQRGMEFLAAQNVRQSFTLQLGQLAETVTVEATTPLVNTVSSEQRESRSELEVTNLPVARRNYSSLLAIGTGVTYTGSSGNSVRLNGLGKSGTNITVDGTDASANPEGRATSMYQGFNYIDTLSIEGIQELQVIKGVIQAEYGQTLGGNVNLLTKSGTNTFHGSLFENFQAENLNARSQFLRSKAPLTFNQYGGSLGGPVKHDRIFFFGAYEGYQERAFRAVSGNTPTPEFRAQVLRAQPIYKRAFDTLPEPNQPDTNPGDEVGFFLGATGSRASDNHVVVKGDIRVTEASNLALTYTRGRPFRINPSYRIGND
ncbi:MAG: carboxypeptidase regulatory-like domain-containing protein, partial [Acidobacteria bacterium]|nr:carboxypeptidase regulatory-like domain-containing protein [Acidobacteriota bacterium]